MDGLFQLIDLISVPVNSSLKKKVETNSSHQSNSSDQQDEPTLTLQVKCDPKGNPNGLRISTVGNSKDAPPDKVRQLGLNADLTGPVQAQVSGRVEESSSGFQAELDLSILGDQTNQTDQPKCVWSTYDSGNKSSGSFGLNDILDGLFSNPGKSESPLKQLPTLIGMVEEIMQQSSESEEENITEPEDLTEYENKIVYLTDSIKGTYHTDVNILRIDQLIQNKIRNEKLVLPDKIRMRTQLQLKLNQSVRRSEMVEIKRRLKKLNQQIDRLESDQKLTEYLTLANDYLDKYRQMGKFVQVINFGQDDQVKQVDPNRLRVIMGYLGVARKYIQINLMHVERIDQTCQICGESLKDVYPGATGLIKCPSCQVETLYLQPTQQDMYVSGTGGKCNYKDRETFEKGISRYEGKQKARFPDNLIEILDQHLKSKGYPHRGNYLSFPLVGKIEGRRRRQGTSREIMMTALQEVSFSAHYEDCNLLCHIIWGSELPDLTLIRERILRDYDTSQQVFNKVKGNRKSSLGADYRLFRHLWHLGYPCHPADFKIVTTPTIIKYYEEVWEKVCDQIGEDLGWKPFVRIEALRQMDINTLRLPTIPT